MIFDAELGPVNFVVTGFSDLPLPRGGFGALLELEEAGRIRILDVDVITKESDGHYTVLDTAEAGVPELALYTSHLIDAQDISHVVSKMETLSVAVVVVYEDLNFLPVIRAWGQESGDVLFEGPVLVDDLVETVSTIEGHNGDGTGDGTRDGADNDEGNN